MKLLKYTIVVIFVLKFINVKSQSKTELLIDTLNSAYVEQKSYDLYNDKNWSELIKFGNQSINKGFNYYYLQLRVGIAYYEKKNYSLALGHFKKALVFNLDDELTLEYMYFCYIYNGRHENARELSKQFNLPLLQKIGIAKQSNIEFAIIEGGTKITDSVEYYNKAKNGTPNYFKPPIYFQLGLNHYIKNRVSLFHALTYFNQQSFLGTVKQYQYFIKATVPIKNNWLMLASLHCVNLNTTSKLVTTTIDTLWPPGVLPHTQQPAGAPPLKTKKNTITTQTKNNANYFVGALNAQKTINKFTIGIGTTVSNIGNITQFINNSYLSCNVFGNTKLVLGCIGYMHTKNNYKTTYASVMPFLSINPITKLSIKLSYLLNTKYNIIEENGYLINNSPDLSSTRYSSLINFNITKHLAIYGLYQLEFKQENLQLFNYRYNVMVAGFKITP